MQTFEIVPHVGVGPIKLAMTRLNVEACFGLPEFEGNGRVGYLSGFMIDYDEHDKVEFIELAKSSQFDTIFHGVNLHTITAREAVKIVERHDHYDKNVPDPGYSYIFKGLQLSLWRRVLPQTDTDPDDQGQHFDAIGIAVHDYF